MLSSCREAEGDLLSSQDWGEGEVGENVSSIVEELMKKTITSEGEERRRRGRGGKGERGGGTRGQHDPRVTMEMRHKQV